MMSIRISKCITCKKYMTLEKAPWGTCQIFKEDIPDEYFNNTIDSSDPIRCEDYDYNPHWEEEGDD